MSLIRQKIYQMKVKFNNKWIKKLSKIMKRLKSNKRIVSLIQKKKIKILILIKKMKRLNPNQKLMMIKSQVWLT